MPCASVKHLRSWIVSEIQDMIELNEEQQTPDREKAIKRSTWASVCVNVCLSIGQIFTGLFSGSLGLISDGIHSLSDLVADFVVLFAAHHSQKEADEDHSYGHYRYENAASLVLGAILLIVAIGMIWSGTHKLEDPESIPTVHLVALWVALAALVAKELLFRYMLAVAKRVRSSMLIANAWHARSDAASSLVVALGIGGNLLGYPLLDPIAAIIVGFMVGRMGWSFFWAALNDLMDRSATMEEIEAITKTIAETPGVLAFHDLKTRKMGDMIIADIHLELDGDLTVREGHDIALLVINKVLKEHQVLNLMTHVDPYEQIEAQAIPNA